MHDALRYELALRRLDQLGQELRRAPRIEPPPRTHSARHALGRVLIRLGRRLDPAAEVPRPAHRAAGASAYD